MGCVNLVNAQYHILNKPYSKEEYKALLQQWTPDDYARLQNQVEELSKTLPHPYATVLRSENCTGDYISDSKDCRDCFIVRDSENVCYSQGVVDNSKDVYDVSNWGQNIANCYE